MNLSRLEYLLALMMFVWGGALVQAEDLFDAVLAKAGDNRVELEAFITTSKNEHGEFGHRAAIFLV